MWPLPLTLAMTLTLNFQGQTEFAISQPKFVWLPRNKKQTYRWNSRPQMWPSPLTLIFQGQICNLLYLSPKWSDCHETKSNHIDWTLGLKCDHQVWPWPWDSPWIFKVKYGICYISTKKVRLPWNEKQTYRMNSRHQMWPMGLTLEMTLIFEFSRSNVTYTFDHTHGVDQGFSFGDQGQVKGSTS